MLDNVISTDVILYDERFKSWNYLERECEPLCADDMLAKVTCWWNQYSRNSNNLMYQHNLPKHVWEILEQCKISKVEKIYGIYYSIQLLDNKTSEVNMFDIQLEDGTVDKAISYESYLVVDGQMYDENITRYSILGELL